MQVTLTLWFYVSETLPVSPAGPLPFVPTRTPSIDRIKTAVEPVKGKNGHGKTDRI